MASEILTKEELEDVARRALIFQRYFFRRAYGTYYAVWATALSVFFVIPFLVGSAGEFFVLMLQIATGIVATVITVQNFTRVIRANRLWQAFIPRRRRVPYFFFIIAWWVGFILVIYFGFRFSTYAGYTSIYLMLISVVYFLALNLKRSFQDKIPFEGKIAVGSYGLSATASFILSVAFGPSNFVSVPWLLTIACWIFASTSAFRHAHEELLMEGIETLGK